MVIKMIKKYISVSKSQLINQFSDLIMYILFFINLYTFAVNGSAYIYQLRYVFLFISGTMGFILTFVHRKNIKIYYIIIFICVCWGFSCIFRSEGTYPIELFKYSIMYMGVSLNIIDHNHNIKYSKILYYLASFVILYQLIILKVPIRSFMKDGTSYNYISVLLLFYLLYYCITCIQQRKKIDYFSAILFFIISLLAYGRGGIVTATFFLIFVVMARYKEINKTYQKIIVGILIFILFILIIINFSNIFIESGLFNKFIVRSNISEESRLLVWKAYIENLFGSCINILFGGTKFIAFESGNIHNSFLQIHASIGLLPLIYICYSYLSYIKLNLKERNYMPIICLLALVLRAMLDQLFFQGYNEIFLYYFVFESLKQRRHFNER